MRFKSVLHFSVGVDLHSSSRQGLQAEGTPVRPFVTPRLTNARELAIGLAKAATDARTANVLPVIQHPEKARPLKPLGLQHCSARRHSG